MTKKFSELHGRISTERRARIESLVRAAIAEMPLQDLRRARAVTQVELAKAMGTSQGEISKIEQRADLYLSTLREYVDAMGGELELVARFPDGQVKISSLGEGKSSRRR
jgi:hypothetical protein